MEAPRYTAKEIEDGLYSGMDPDVELVAAQYYDALRAELARVKAESLRVVKDGDMREAYRCDKVLHDGRYCVVGRRILDDYFPIQISDAITGKYVDKVTHQTLLQPVRLERWEDE